MIVRRVCDREQCEVSGWCPSLLACSIEWRWCVLLLACTVQWCSRALPIPPQYSLVLLSCHAAVLCWVCDVCSVRLSEVLCGGVYYEYAPLVVVVGAAIVDGGVA